MDFEKVQFAPFMVANLYKNTLVVVDDVSHIKKAGSKVTAETASNKFGPGEAIPGDEFKEAIVAAPAEQVTTVAFKYLGGFGKKVIIVVAEHFHPHIAGDDLEFLSKLLIASKLSLDDVAILNTVNNLQAARLWELMPANVILLFDVDHAAVGLSFRRPHFEIQEWSGAFFMSAPALEHFRIGPEADVQTLKRKLWTGLQKIFLGK